VKALLLCSAMLLAACASGGAPPIQSFEDLPAPRQWIPYSRDWMRIETPSVTAAKFIYFSEAKVDATLDQAREALSQSGWRETGSERFVNPEKFPGVWADFAKGADTCRVTVIEGTYATHVDYTVARVSRPR
jgi:hypothetical protein